MLKMLTAIIKKIDCLFAIHGYLVAEQIQYYSYEIQSKTDSLSLLDDNI